MAALSRCGFQCVRYLEVEIHCKTVLGPRLVSAVLSFSEVTNTLLVWYCRSITEALSALGSVSTSRSVRFRRLNCVYIYIYIYICMYINV